MDSLDDDNQLNEKIFRPSDIWYLETTYKQGEKTLREIEMLIRKGNGYSLYNVNLEEAFNMNSKNFQRMQYPKTKNISDSESVQIKRLYECNSNSSYRINLKDLNPLIIKNVSLLTIFNDFLFETTS